MSNAVFAGDTSGSITVQVPAVAGTNTLTLPAKTGNVAVDGPVFSAYMSSGQTLASNTFTKIQFQTKEFDTANCYDNTTNYRFTPNVAGYYQVSGGLAMSTNASAIQLMLYKNGSLFKALNSTYGTTTSWLYGSCLVYLNGTTDYIEIWSQIGTGQVINPGASYTYFQAAFIRGV